MTNKTHDYFQLSIFKNNQQKTLFKAMSTFFQQTSHSTFYIYHIAVKPYRRLNPEARVPLHISMLPILSDSTLGASLIINEKLVDTQ